MPPYMIIIIIILSIIVVLAFIGYNNLVKLNQKVKEAFSTMDIYLKKRWDLIPNLTKTVKGYAKHEKDTLENIILLRNSAYDKLNEQGKIDTAKSLSAAIEKVMILAESYPELKANDNFKNLAKELASVENDIANARKYYNATVRMYNNKVEMFPSNLIAKCLGYKTKPMFEIENEERENVDVNVQ